MQIQVVDVERLSEHLKASALIPEMTETEWKDFFKSVEDNGIRQPIDANTEYQVLDGRHRLRAAKKLGIKKIEVRFHELTEEEQMKFVRDTAIERRSLTTAQRIHIVLSTEELVNSIYEEGRENKRVAIKKAHQNNPNHKVDSFYPTGPKQSKDTHNSNVKLAEIANVSKNQIVRIKKIKREDPELYEQVLKGEKTISGAYLELPTTVDKHQGKYKPVCNDDKNNVSKEEINKQMFNANVSTFVMHLEQILGFVQRVENVTQIIKEASNKLDKKQCASELEKISKLLRVGGNENE